ncbi:RNA polymerase III (C) subunit [Scheffersomyces xylosifermentans]|uniref:RNA polymerase III (C) subunit n=1 Tax=Scheffersomyces xylosifermentans TaxID=1304137 RepID=UPI00315DC47C
MSNRLESLNSKKPASSSSSSPSSKTSLKFKPKVVPRKSKEERAKEAPVQVKEEPGTRGSATRGGRGGSTRGRGRGGRNNYAGTHLVSSGPLSSGSVSIGNVNGSKLGLTSDRTFNSVSPTPEFLQNLKLKEKTKSPTPGSTRTENGDDQDEDQDDPTKINMTQQYRFADEETVLFPVRPERDDPEDETKEAIKIESSDPTRENTPAVPSEHHSREVTVKSEPIEEKLEQIMNNKAKLQMKLLQGNDAFEQEEYSKMISDHQELLDILTDRLGGLSTDSETPEIEDENETKYIAFQLPKKLPGYVNESSVKAEPGLEKETTKTKPSYVSPLVTSESTVRGQIGHLNIHQSGKFSINIGNDIDLTVSKGATASFLQEVVIIDLSEEVDTDENIEMLDEDGKKVRGRLLRLGKLEGKIIGTPLIQ